MSDDRHEYPEHPDLAYEVELVGGPFDGATELLVGGDPSPPESLWVYTCTGEWCGRDPTFTFNGRHRTHTFASVPDAMRPPTAVEYTRTDVGQDGRRLYAVYARGGVVPVGGERARARVPA